MSFNVIALLTNAGKRALATGLMEGTPVHVKYFSLGMLGHDPEDPKTELTPDPSLEDPKGIVLPVKNVTRHYLLDNFTPVWVCNVERGELIAQVSALYLYADVGKENQPYGYGGYVPPGTKTIVLGICNFPLKVIVDTDSVEWHVSLAL